MENAKLQSLVEQVSLKYFNKPFQHQAVFNSRLRTTGGRYHLKTHNLDFNPKVAAEYPKEILVGIIKHELCHYHLHLAGLPFQHRDKAFKEMLKEVGGLRYTPLTQLEREKFNRWQYQCLGCGRVIYRKRRFNTKRFICPKCQGFFKKIGGNEELAHK